MIRPDQSALIVPSSSFGKKNCHVLKLSGKNTTRSIYLVPALAATSPDRPLEIFLKLYIVLLLGLGFDVGACALSGDDLLNQLEAKADGRFDHGQDAVVAQSCIWTKADKQVGESTGDHAQVRLGS